MFCRQRMTIALLAVTAFLPICFAQEAKMILQQKFDAQTKFPREVALPTGAALSQGTIMLKVQPQEELRSLEKRLRLPLVETEKKQALDIFLSAASSVQLGMLSGASKEDRRFARFEFTHLNAGKWYSFAFTWDSAKGTMDIYADGQLYTHLAEAPRPMPSPGTKLILGGPGTLIDDFRLYDRPLSDDEIARLTEVRPEDKLTDEGIQVYSETLADYPVKKELIYENDFNGNLNDWGLEGPGVTKIEDGRLYMESREPKDGHIVFWNKKDFPASFLAEWDFYPANDSALYIIFFCAKGRNGKDIFDPSLEKRDGVFKQYILGDINAYHISYFRNLGVESGVCNMRKEYGFHLVSIGKDPMPPVPGGKYHITLLKKGPMICFFIEGKLVIRFDDDGKTYGPVWADGKMGLRQMAPSKAYYDNFRVYKLVE